MSSYNFPIKKKPAPEAPTQPQKLDLSGLDMRPVEVSPEKEKAAIATGEKLGYVAREAAPESQAAPASASGRRRKKQPSRSIYVQGPANIIERFIQYTDEMGATAYWQAIEKLLNEKKR